MYDVHFWIGKYSTQDEYGTAAYKTVELDTYHDDKPIQHREVMGHESKLFLGYFGEWVLIKPKSVDTIGNKRLFVCKFQMKVPISWVATLFTE